MNGPTRHKLKCDYCEFLAVEEGWKTYEVRLADRDFTVHDFLVLEAGEHNSIEVKILIITRLTGPILPPADTPHWWSMEDAMRHGVVVMGFDRVERTA